ncbi:MAG: hypothetical protein ACK4NC_02675 [Candidatus Gracilibacteria bacterium]
MNKLNRYVYVGVILCTFTSCSLPWQAPAAPTPTGPDNIERAFPDDLAWVENYGRPEYIAATPTIKTPTGPSNTPDPNFPRQWKIYRHSTLPISFAYPADAVVTKREIDLDNGDNAIDVEIREPRYNLITLTFQRDIPQLSHIATSQKSPMTFGGLTGMYYNARNFGNGNPSLEKFIANLPNSRYGIHVAGQGPLFQTLLSSIQLY